MRQHVTRTDVFDGFDFSTVLFSTELTSEVLGGEDRTPLPERQFQGLVEKPSMTGTATGTSPLRSLGRRYLALKIVEETVENDKYEL